MIIREYIIIRKGSITIGYLSEQTQTRFSNNGRIGKVYANKDLITLHGQTEYLKLDYEAQFKVIPQKAPCILFQSSSVFQQPCQSLQDCNTVSLVSDTLSIQHDFIRTSPQHKLILVNIL